MLWLLSQIPRCCICILVSNDTIRTIALINIPQGGRDDAQDFPLAEPTRRRAVFFPAALILYDFSAYLTTDLIQPGILHVVRDFNADVALAPASVSLYMAGGMALQWLLGPLSDRIGRRPVLLTGALIFHPRMPGDPVHHLHDARS